MTTLTAEQLQSNIEQLSLYSDSDLKSFTVKQLRQKLSSCKITKVNTNDDDYKTIWKAKKDDLINAIKSLTEKQKVINQVVPELNETKLEEVENLAFELGENTMANLETIAIETYQDLYAYTQERYDSNTQSWKAPNGEIASIAARVSNYLALYPNRDGMPIAHTTRTRYASHINSAIAKMIDNEKGTWYYEQLKENFEGKRGNDGRYLTNHHFKRMMSIQLKDSYIVKRESDVKQIDDRTHDYSKINIDEMIFKAYETLENLDEESPKTMWKDVGISLGLVTGRRLSEVYATAKFETKDDNEVEFWGQLKTKGKSAEHYEENPSYVIPTLIPANLVVKGLKWLDDNGKRADNQHKAHNNYSKYVNQHIKREWGNLIKVLEGSFEPTKKLTFHDLRQLYAVACCTVFKPSSLNPDKYKAMLMGHSEDDMTTVQRYHMDFELNSDTGIVIKG